MGSDRQSDTERLGPTLKQGRQDHKYPCVYFFVFLFFFVVFVVIVLFCFLAWCLFSFLSLNLYGAKWQRATFSVVLTDVCDPTRSLSANRE